MFPQWRAAILVLIIATILHLPGLCRAETFVYVSVAGEDRIAIYRWNADRNVLVDAGDVKIHGGPGALTASPSGGLLFGSLRSAGRLASFRINAMTGALTLLSNVSAGADPAFVATDRSGKFLLTAYYVAGKVTVHQILENGKLSEQPTCSVDTADKAHGIATDRGNEFALVPHTGPNCIFQFQFDSQTGLLKPNAPDRVQAAVGQEPRHLVLHPSLNRAYVSNERGSSVTTYDVDSQIGTLRATQTISTLPSGFEKRNSCARIEITRDGRFVYVSNRGHDSIACFRVDAQSGLLESVGQVATEQTPRGFAVDPQGRFLAAGGQDSGKLAVYRIQDSGLIDRTATHSVGKRPWWVLALDVN